MANEKPPKGKRRNVELSDDAWASVGAIAGKTNRSKSEVVEEAVTRYATSEEQKLFGRAKR